MDYLHVFKDLLNLNPTVGINPDPYYLLYIPVLKFFGVPILFVLKFFGELFLLFTTSAMISHVLKIDKASRD